VTLYHPLTGYVYRPRGLLVTLAQVTPLGLDFTGLWPRTKRRSNAIGRILAEGRCRGNFGRAELAKGRRSEDPVAHRKRGITRTACTVAGTGCLRTSRPSSGWGPVRSEVRTAVVRHHQHLLRRPVRCQSPGQSWLHPRQPAALPAGLYRLGGDHRRDSSWSTRCLPGNATLRRPWKGSSKRWKRGVDGPAAFRPRTGGWSA
jgi:hypothetical protein